MKIATYRLARVGHLVLSETRLFDELIMSLLFALNGSIVKFKLIKSSPKVLSHLCCKNKRRRNELRTYWNYVRLHLLILVDLNGLHSTSIVN